MGFADQMVQSALVQSQKVGEGVGTSFNTGAELALKAEEIQQKKEAIAQEQQKLMMAKFEKVGTWFESLAKMPEGKAKNAFSKNFIPQGIQALGLQDKINPTVLEMMQGDASLATSLRSAIVEGRLSVADLQDPAKIAQAYPDLMRSYSAEQIKQSVENNPEAFVKATEDRQKNLAQAAALQAQNTRQDKEIASKGKEQLAKKAADLYANYQGAGGKASIDKNLEAFSDAIKQLETNQVVFGTLGKNLPYGSSENVMARLDPKAKALVDQVRGAINMRLALSDPNPTEMQVNRILNQLIDPRLDNKTNIKKLNAYLTSTKQDIANKEALFRDQGFKVENAQTSAPTGGAVNPVEFFADAGKVSQAKALIQKNPANAAAIAARLGITEQQLMQELNKR